MSPNPASTGNADDTAPTSYTSPVPTEAASAPIPEPQQDEPQEDNPQSEIQNPQFFKEALPPKAAPGADSTSHLIADTARFQAHQDNLDARAAEQQTRLEAAAARQQDNEARKQRNDALLAQYEQQNRPFYHDAHGLIQPKHTDEEWAAQQKQAAQNEALTGLYKQQNRPFFIDKGTGDVTPVHSDEQWQDIQNKKAVTDQETARKAAIDQELAAHEAKTKYDELTNGTVPLKNEERHALTKQLADDTRTAVTSLLPKLTETAKATQPTSGWYPSILPGGSAPTSQAQAAQQHAASLRDKLVHTTDPHAPLPLDDKDLSLLQQVDPKLHAKITDAQQKLQADTQNQAAAQAAAQKRAELILRRDNPDAWLAAQRQQILTSPDPQAHAQSLADNLAEGIDRHQQAIDDLQAQRQHHADTLDAIRADNAATLAKGVAGTDLLDVPGPPDAEGNPTHETWSKAQYTRFQQAKAQADQFENDTAPLRAQLAQQADSLKQQAQIVSEAHDHAANTAVSQRDQYLDNLAATGNTRVAAQARALDDEFTQRAQDLFKHYPGGPGESEEAADAFSALQQDQEARNADLDHTLATRAQAADTLYQALRNQNPALDWSKVASDRTMLNMAENTAKEKGLDLNREEIINGLTTRRIADWSQPYQEQLNWQLKGGGGPNLLNALPEGVGKVLKGEQKDMQPFRLLPDGSPTINPAFIIAPGQKGKTEWNKAVDAAIKAANPPTPEAVAQLRQNLVQQRSQAMDQLAQRALPLIGGLGTYTDWKDAESKRDPGFASLPPLQQMARYLDTRADPGTLKSALGSAVGAVGSGLGDLLSSAAGAGAWAAHGLGLRSVSQGLQHVGEAVTHSLQAQQLREQLLGYDQSPVARTVGGLTNMGVQMGALMTGAGEVAEVTRVAGLMREAGSASGLIKALGSVAPATAGHVASTALFGAQALGSTYVHAVQAYKEQGMNDDQAHNAAMLPAFAAGLGTAALAGLQGAHGVQSVLAESGGLKAAIGADGIKALATLRAGGLKTLAQPAVRQAVLDTALAMSKNFITEGSSEAVKMAMFPVLDAIVAKASYNPDLKPGDVIAEAIQSGLLGGIVGGATGAIHSLRGHQEPAAPPPVWTRPETIKAAEHQIDHLTIPGASPEQNAHAQTIASTLLSIAQGGHHLAEDAGGPTADELASVGLARGKDGAFEQLPQSADGSPPRVQLDADGQPQITPEAMDRLQQWLPAVHRAIPVDEAGNHTPLSPSAEEPEAQATAPAPQAPKPRGGSSQGDAAPAETGGSGKTQEGGGARSAPPSSAPAKTPEEFQRGAERRIKHLAAAEKIGEQMQSGQPIAWGTSGGEFTAGHGIGNDSHIPLEPTPAEKKALQRAAQENQLAETPEERLAANQAMQEALRAPTERAVAKLKAEGMGEFTEANRPKPKPDDADLRQQVRDKKISLVDAARQVLNDSPGADEDEAAANLQQRLNLPDKAARNLVTLIKGGKPSDNPKSAIRNPQSEERARILGQALVDGGKHTVEQAKVLANRYVAERGITHADHKEQFIKDFQPWVEKQSTPQAADPFAKKTAAADTTIQRHVVFDEAKQQFKASRDGKSLGYFPSHQEALDAIAREDARADTQKQPSDNPKSAIRNPQSSNPATSLLDDSSFQSRRKEALGKLKPAQRQRAAKLNQALDENLVKLGHGFPAIHALSDAENAARDKSGAIAGPSGLSVATSPVKLADGTTAAPRSLLIHFPTLFKEFDTRSPTLDRQGLGTALEEEFNHAHAISLFKPSELAQTWRDLGPEVQKRLWEGYHKWAIEGKQKPATPPADLTESEQAGQMFELLMMTTNKAVFGRFTQETLAADAEARGQATKSKPLMAIAQFFRTLLTRLRQAINSAPRAAKHQFEEYEAKLTAALKASLKATPAPAAERQAAPNLAAAGGGKSVLQGQRVPVNARPKPLEAVTGHETTAYTDNNDPVKTRWAVANVGDLVISNDDAGRINPAYPQALQPRDRTSAGSEAQVQDIASKANLDRLSHSPTVGDGAPIVGGQDSVVESGNGRLMGLRRAYSKGMPSASTYRNALIERAAEFGLDPEKVKAMPHPVLVRERLSDVDRHAFVLAANVSNIAPKREVEVAKTDAAQIVPDLFDTFTPDETGDFLHGHNHDFIRAFVREIVPPAERPGIIDSQGGLSQSGYRRIRNALFVYAYGTSPEALNALSSLTESPDPASVNIANAVVAAAPTFAEQNAREKAGALHPLGITHDIVAALQAYTHAKRGGQTIADYLAQDRIPGIDDAPTPLQAKILQTLDANSRAPRRLMEIFARYATAVDNAGDPRQAGLFGDTKPTREDLWNLASKPQAETPTLATPARGDNPQSAIRNPQSQDDLEPKTALNLFRRLTNLRDKGHDLAPGQRRALQSAETSLDRRLFTPDRGRRDDELETHTPAYKLNESARPVSDADLQGYFHFAGLPAAKQDGTRRAMQSADRLAAKPYPVAGAGTGIDPGRLAQRKDEAARPLRGLREGDTDAVRAGLDTGKPVSYLLHDLASRAIPSFNIRGAVIEDAGDLARLCVATRTPYFESLKVAVLDPAKQVIHSQVVHVGSLNESVASIPSIFGVVEAARQANPGRPLGGFIISHNHPSGDVSPSEADKRITARIRDAANDIGVPLIDHVITNGEKYFSFRAYGLLHTDPKFNGRYKPQLPVLQTTDTVTQGQTAPWESMPASERDLMKFNDPGSPYIKTLRTADPDHHHFVYLDTRGRITAIERLPVDKTPAEAGRAYLAGATREGAHSVFLNLAGVARSTENRELVRHLASLGRNASVELTDALGEREAGDSSPDYYKNGFFSYRNTGLLEGRSHAERLFSAATGRPEESPTLKTAPRAAPETPEETPEETEALDKQFAAAAKAKPVLDALTRRIADQFGAHAVIPENLKGRARALSKARSDYAGDFTKLKDLARTTIECKDLASAKACAAEIERLTGQKPKRNLFEAHPVDGYRDALFHVPVEGTTAEIQVHVPEVLAVKHQLHGAYVRREELLRSIKDQQRTPTDRERERIDRLNRVMKHFYDHALGIDTPLGNSSSTSTLKTAPRAAPETPEETEALDKQFEAAAKAKPVLDALTRRIADQFGAHAVIPENLKGRARALSKARSDYAGDFTKLKDLARTTIECKDLASAKACAAEIERLTGQKPKRNLFEAHPVDGYRDALFHVPVEGTTAEIQVHVPEVLAVKHQLHGAYVRREELLRSIKDQQRTPTDREHERIDRLNRVMKRFYDHALGIDTPSGNSSSTSSGLTRKPPLSLISSSEMGRGGPSESNAQPTPSLSTTTANAPSGLDSSGTSMKARAPGNSEGLITPYYTTGSASGQAPKITTANIHQFAGDVDTSKLRGRQQDYRNAFDVQPGDGHVMMPLAELVSPKNELVDPRFLAGAKPDPRQTAANFVARALDQEPGIKHRAPLDVVSNHDGTYTIQDGNATAQALMLAGWTHVPVKVRPSDEPLAPATEPGYTAPLATANRKRPGEDQDQLNLFDLLTPAQQTAKHQQPDLFGNTTHASPGLNPRPRPADQRPLRPAATSTSRFAKPAESTGDLFGGKLAPGGESPGGSRHPAKPGTGGTAHPGGGTDGGTHEAAGGEPAGSGATSLPGSGADLQHPHADVFDADSPRPLQRPELDSPAHNFAPPEHLESLAPSGTKAKIDANLNAIRLLKSLEDEGRDATPEEKRQLAAYTGWGAFKEAFNQEQADARKYWAEHLQKNPYYAQYKPRELTSWEERHGPTHDLLRKAMNEQEFNAAARSTLNAHYTAAPIIRAMWRMVERLGFKGGRALEPSAGVGHYIGLQPHESADRTQWQAVELDDLTSRLLSKLYPEATVNEKLGDDPARQVTGLGFERARIPNGSQDLIISNVPFHESGPRKKGFPNLNLHNFFFAHALDKVKPGGLVAFITSDSTMQNNIRQRDFLASKGDLVAAFRLPNNAFKGNAGTEVTTDILLMRKPDGTPFKGEPWRNLVEVGRHTITLTQGKDQLADDFRREAKAAGTVLKEYRKGDRLAADVSAPVHVNEYFANHPDHVLGEHTLEGSMYRAGQYAVKAPEGLDVPARLDELADRLPENVMGKQEPADAHAALADKGDRPFSFQERDGKIWEVQDDGSMKEADWATNPAMVKTFRSWRQVSDAARDLVEAENNPRIPDGALDAMRAHLNRVYDQHVAFHKPISRKYGNLHSHLKTDPGYPLTAALEDEKVTIAPQSGKRTYSYLKAPIFKRRMVQAIEPPTHATGPDDAIEKSLAWNGRIDPEYAASLLKTTPEAFKAEALKRPDIFENPGSSQLETAENYLTGNIRAKLEAAQGAAADDPKYQKNVDALTKAMPEPRTMANITPVMGAAWIPEPVYEAFIRDVLKGNDTVEYVPAANTWRIEGTNLYRNEDFRTDRKGAFSLFEHALDMSEPMIYDTQRDGTRVFNPTETAAAKNTLKKMREAFVQYVKTSESPVTLLDKNAPAPPEGAESLAAPEPVPVWKAAEDAFNQKCNSYVTPRDKGDYLTFPGLNTDYVYTRAHRRAVIARFLRTQRGMMAHGVGSGKTFNQIILAKELRRLGLAKKPVIAVQNSTLAQFATSFLRAYPGAKILVPDKADFQAQNRQRLTAKIATGDWDAVILPHSQFDLISNKEDSVRAYMDDQIQELRDLIGQERGGSTKRGNSKVRDLQGMLKRLEDHRTDMLEDLKKRQDKSVFWEDLGIDAIIMDEAHNYKSLPIVTRMGRVKGVPASTDSQRAISFMLKVRDVQKRTNGKNIFLATGTPIKNSMAEAYIHMQYMAPDVLADYGIHNFDNFATTFGALETKTEMGWGGTPKVETRFAKFQNGQSLVTMIRSVFDVAMGNEKLGLDVPKMEGGGPEMVVVPATPTMEKFNAWVRSVADRWKNATPEEKELYGATPIQTMQAGTAAAADPRIIAPGAPDHPDSKVNTLLKSVLALYKKGNARKETQAIFADQRNPFKLDYLLPFTGHPLPEYAANPDPAGKPFDLYEDMKRKLIGGGIPASEIHLMQSGMTDDAKEKLFQKVNNGEIRVIIGSTELLGVGVNIQERLKALHHLSPPRDMTPAMKDQRDGRLIRQGNLHAATVDGAPAWDEPVNNRQYGTEGSTDASIYGTMARKSKFISQLLMGDLTTNNFDDPTDAGSMSLGEMAARTMGDPDFIRRIEIEKELGDLRLERDAHTNELSARRSRLASHENYLRQLPGWIAAHRQTAEAIGQAFKRTAPPPEGVKDTTDISDKPVYEFGGRTIDSAAKDAKVVEPLDLWLLNESKTMERQGRKVVTRPLTINGTPFDVDIHTTLPGEPTTGNVKYKGNDLGNYNGAQSLLSKIRTARDNARYEADNHERDIPRYQDQINELRRVIDTAGPFEHADKLTALEQELEAVDARLTARATPTPPPGPAPLPEGHVRPEKPLPPLQAVDPRLMTDAVADTIGSSKISGNSLVLPPGLDRQHYIAVNKALESAGGVWDRKAQAHLFAGDPTDALLHPERFQASQPLATANRDIPAHLLNGGTDPEDVYSAHGQPDPFTGHPSLINGPSVPPGHAAAIYQRIARNLEADTQRRRAGGSAAADEAPQAANGPLEPPLVDLARFGFENGPNNNPSRGPLRYVGGQAEGTVYKDPNRGVVYKFLHRYDGSGSRGAWPAVKSTEDGRLAYDLEPARTDRQLAARIGVQTGLGGTPTEIVGRTPEGHTILKQPLSADPELEHTTENLSRALDRMGAVQVPQGMVRGNLPVHVAWLRDKPWLITDARPDNFIGDTSDHPRANDLIVSNLHPDVVQAVRGLDRVIAQARDAALRQGQRDNRLFTADRGRDDEPDWPANDVGDYARKMGLPFPHEFVGARDFNSAAVDYGNRVLPGNRDAAVRLGVGAASAWHAANGAFDWDPKMKDNNLRIAKANIRDALSLAGKSKGIGLGTWQNIDGNLWSDGPLHRGETTVPTAVQARYLTPRESPEDNGQRGLAESRVSNSAYPMVAFRLDNGAQVVSRIRFSDHGQVSERAPRTYDVDVRVSSNEAKTKTAKALVAEYHDQILKAANDHKPWEELWNDQREQNAQSTPLTGQAGESRQDMPGRGPSKTGQINSPQIQTESNNDLPDSLHTPARSEDEAPTNPKSQIRNPQSRAPGSWAYNHIDKAVTGAIGRAFRAVRESTPAQALATYVGNTRAGQFFAHALDTLNQAARKQLVPIMDVPGEALSLWREMNMKKALGKELALDPYRSMMTGKGRFTDYAYPEGFKDDAMAKKRLFLAMDHNIDGHIPLESLPPEQQALARQLRDLDRQGLEEAVRQGRMSLETFQNMQNGMPHYYPEDPEDQNVFSAAAKLVLRVNPNQAQRSTAWHIIDTETPDPVTRLKGQQGALVPWDSKGKNWRYRSREHRDAFYRDFIKDRVWDQLKNRSNRKIAEGLTRASLDNPETLSEYQRGFIKHAEEGARRRWIKGAPLDLEGHEKAGLIMDPVYALMRRVAATQHDNAVFNYFNAIADNKEWTSDAPAQGFTPIPDSRSFGRLAGKHVQNSIARQVLDTVPERGALADLYDALVRLWAKGKTVWNVGTHVRNFLRNVNFSRLAGNNTMNPANFPYYRDAVKIMRDQNLDAAHFYGSSSERPGGMTSRELMRELFENRVTGAGYTQTELRGALRELLPDPGAIGDPERPMNFVQQISRILLQNSGRIGQALAKTDAAAAHIYEANNEFFKIASYLKNKAMGMSPAEAAAETRKWFHYYDEMGRSESLGTIRRFFPFFSAVREDIRVLSNAVRERPLNLAMSTLVPLGLTKLAFAMLGLRNQQDQEQIMKDMRGHLKGSGDTLPVFSILLPFRMDDKLAQWDLTNTNGFSHFLGSNLDTSSHYDLVRTISKELSTGSPFISILHSLAANEDPFNDRPVTQPDMTPGEMYAAQAAQVAQTLLPAMAPVPGSSAWNTIAQSLERGTDKSLSKRSTTQAILRSILGIDVRNAEPDLQRYIDDQRAALKLPENVFAGGSTAQQRLRHALFSELLQSTDRAPNLPYIKRLLDKLQENGKPVGTQKDIHQLLFARDPLSHIADKQHQQQILANAPPEIRQGFDNAADEFQRVTALAPAIIAQAQAQ